MKLSDGEKIIMLMLSEIYEKLDIQGEIEPDFIKSAIFGDHIWGLKWKYPGISFEESSDPPIIREVVDILDMWDFIEFSYQKLADEEKEKLEHDANPFGKDPKFQGFDGNNETEHMGTAMFLVNRLDRFKVFKGRGFNCHMPSLDMHRRMLSIFEPIRKNLSGKPLTVEDLTKILREITHPSRREA